MSLSPKSPITFLDGGRTRAIIAMADALELVNTAFVARRAQIYISTGKRLCSTEAKEAL